jgi:hypothetical protein
VHTPFEQIAGSTQFAAPLLPQFAPSWAAARHVPAVAPTVGSSHVPLLEQRVRFERATEHGLPGAAVAMEAHVVVEGEQYVPARASQLP